MSSRIIVPVLTTRTKVLLPALALLALTLAGGFLWGFLVHRNHWFPYWHLRRAFHLAKPGEELKMLIPNPQPRVSLISVPYIAGTHDPNIGEVGVVKWDRERASPGLNLFNSTGRKEVQLLEMSGRIVHRWRYPRDWPVALAVALPDGSLLGIEENVSLFKLDRDGRELWRWAEPAHHSIELDDRGHIWTMTREKRAAAHSGPNRGAINDFIVELTPDGKLVQKIAILETLSRSPFSGLIPTFLEGQEGEQPPGESVYLDMIHANHAEVFDGSLEKSSPLYTKGNLLVSLRNMHAIAILNGSSHEILWFWGPGYLFAQHHPTLIENGNIVVFNNGVERSSIVEVDPRTNRIVWEYAPESGFFSKFMGSCQRLPNGNTLVSDSEAGRVFEVTSNGDIVWHFANPDRHLVLGRDRDRDLRQVIYRVERYPPAYFGTTLSAK